MTQKSDAEKQSSDPSAKVVVFGLDSNWRPHAAWFPKAKVDPARAAAKQLRLNMIEVTNGTAADLIAKLPAGQIHAAGPAMVPPVREDLYESVVTTLNPRGEAGQAPGRPSRERPSCDLGRHQAGAPCSRPRQFGRRLVRSDCRQPSGRQGHPAVPRLPWLSKLHRPGERRRLGEPSNHLTSTSAWARAAARQPEAPLHSSIMENPHGQPDPANSSPQRRSVPPLMSHLRAYVHDAGHRCPRPRGR